MAGSGIRRIAVSIDLQITWVFSQAWPSRNGTFVPLFQSAKTTQVLRIKNKVLSRWFGAAGLLSSKSLPRNLSCGGSANWPPNGRIWIQKPGDPTPSGSTRPGNAPERRLVGMYYHLARTAEQGLIKAGETLLSQVSQRENDEPCGTSFWN